MSIRMLRMVKLYQILISANKMIPKLLINTNQQIKKQAGDQTVKVSRRI